MKASIFLLPASPGAAFALASAAQNGSKAVNLMTEVLALITKFVSAGGGLWLVWGVIVLATGIKDKSGPQLQSGIWQIVGGGLIIAAASLFGSIPYL